MLVIPTEMFYGCDSLTSMTLPNTIVVIGDGAFEECEALTSISIPDTIRRIGKSAFYECKSLESVIWNEGIPYAGVLIISGYEIADSAFEGCTSLVSLTIPDGIIECIRQRAFYGCCAMNSLVIPNSVRIIGEDAFGEVPHIYYSGTAKGSPWGAETIN